MSSALRNLDWDDLRVFLEAARAQSVSRAAKALGVDHSTVSRRLSRLEFAVGGALFERARDGLRLTDTGLAVLRRAEALSASVADLRDDLVGQGAGGKVRLATMEGIASLFFASRLAQLRESEPDLQVELVTSSQLVRVSRREADLVLNFFEPADKNRVCERIGRFATGLYASQLYLDRAGPIDDVHDLADKVFVGYIEELVALEAVHWLKELVGSARLVFTSNSMIAQMQAARGGLGIVVLPSFAVAEFPDLIPVLPDTLRGHRDLWLSSHPDTARLPRVSRLRQFLKQMIVSSSLFTSVDK